MKAKHRNQARPLTLLFSTLALLAPGAGTAHDRPAPAFRADAKHAPTIVQVRLSEWKVELTPSTVPPGPVSFHVTNAGTIGHAFEVEGHGLERSTSPLYPGKDATLLVNLQPGSYDAYCPIGKGSHEMLGMKGTVTVQGARAARTAHASMHDHAPDGVPAVQAMRVVGGGPVIQILPGPFPFADSARAVIQTRPADQMADLEKKEHLGPYSNNVAAIQGDIALSAFDRGAHGDSVSGEAAFTGRDGKHWKVVLDGVQTQDIPFNPRFGGVIMGLYYHGASNVHTPLVPTIQSSLALWAFAHVYENDKLVADHAMVHVMLLSRTRRPGDWALDCWDCSNRPVEELQLQVTPAPNGPPFDSPGGFLFVNWEKSVGTPIHEAAGRTES
jgi:uncharacterized cupredoxin-like copper-binding protein